MPLLCPGCGLALPASGAPVDPLVNASPACRACCYELAYYTLAKGGEPFFIHQVLVDAYAAQHARPDGPAIGLAFALIGLCLVVGHGQTGRQAQDAHIRLARRRKHWPRFTVPKTTDWLTVAYPLKAEPGEARDAAILEWAKSVWHAYPQETKRTIEGLLEDEEGPASDGTL